ncbi:MAG: hypothetical protein LDL56_09400 [Armatimonadetes bacterium]|nr:hypothetical protein [Armatimonadota bacterium]MCA1997429.1 hypothetical protein [Armatimonadota bacterium]
MGLYDYPNFAQPGETYDCPDWTLRVWKRGDVHIRFWAHFNYFDPLEDDDEGEERRSAVDSIHLKPREVVGFLMGDEVSSRFGRGDKIERDIQETILENPNPILRRAIRRGLKDVDRQEFADRFPKFEHLLPPA